MSRQYWQGDVEAILAPWINLNKASEERIATLEMAINRIAVATLVGTDEVDVQIAAAVDIVGMAIPSSALEGVAMKEGKG